MRYDGQLTFNKVDAVFKSGNETRDSIPSHLVVGADVPEEVATLYEHLCPAQRLRAGRRQAARERAQLHRLQGHRRDRAALDAARRGLGPEVQTDVVHEFEAQGRL